MASRHGHHDPSPRPRNRQSNTEHGRLQTARSVCVGVASVRLAWCGRSMPAGSPLPKHHRLTLPRNDGPQRLMAYQDQPHCRMQPSPTLASPLPQSAPDVQNVPIRALLPDDDNFAPRFTERYTIVDRTTRLRPGQRNPETGSQHVFSHAPVDGLFSLCEPYNGTALLSATSPNASSRGC